MVTFDAIHNLCIENGRMKGTWKVGGNCRETHKLHWHFGTYRVHAKSLMRFYIFDVVCLPKEAKQ